MPSYVWTSKLRLLGKVKMLYLYIFREIPERQRQKAARPPGQPQHRADHQVDHTGLDRSSSSSSSQQQQDLHPDVGAAAGGEVKQQQQVDGGHGGGGGRQRRGGAAAAAASASQAAAAAAAAAGASDQERHRRADRLKKVAPPKLVGIFIRELFMTEKRFFVREKRVPKFAKTRHCITLA